MQLWWNLLGTVQLLDTNQQNKNVEYDRSINEDEALGPHSTPRRADSSLTSPMLDKSPELPELVPNICTDCKAESPVSHPTPALQPQK